MKSLILALLAATLVSTNVNAIGKREEGVLIGIGSAILINSVLRDREHNDVSDYGYGHHDRYRWSRGNEFPAFRCRDNSVQCAYERGVWERERAIWMQEKDRAYRCGRYGECQ
tara:strand:+ start:1155 stop:1493 length:339 start_codon:yes stop_codon:yes gene_type:complete